MQKKRCENCSRLLICEAVKERGKSFCGYECRLNWVRAMRLFEVSARTALRARS